MIVNAGTLIALQKSYRALFMQSFDAYTPSWQDIAMLIESEALSVNHNWLGRPPAMKEWIDSKALESLSGNEYILAVKEWESTIEVFRPHIEADQLGLYRPRIMELGQRAKQHPDALVTAVRVAGASALCYDGQFFYDTDHAEGKSGVQSNKLSQTGVTLANIITDFNLAVAALRGFKDDKGEPFNGDDLKLRVECGPALEAQFRDLLNAKIISNTENTLVGAAALKVNNRLTGNTWWLDEIGGMVKPFIYQVRKQASFVDLIDATNEMVFMRQKYAFSAEASYNAGYGLWQKSVQIG